MGTTIESDWENTRLLEELAAARAEIEDVQFVSQLHYDANLSLRQQLAAEQAKNVRLLDFIARAQVSSGVCCCGEPMDGHSSPMSCGHSPVDMWDHAVGKLLDAPSDTSSLEAKVIAQQARIEQLCSLLFNAHGVFDDGEDIGNYRLVVSFGVADTLCDQIEEALEFQDDLSALRAHDKKLLAPYQWQPIETAPKDGTAILISNGKGAWVAKYKDVYQSGFKPNNPWLSLMLNKDHIPKRLQFGGPTHWMPLPSTEAIEKGSK